MVIHSPFPDVEIPDVALHDFALEGAGTHPDRPAFVDGPSGRTLTFGELAGGVDRVAAGLAGRGLGTGEVVAVVSPNLPEYALAFLGTVRAGGVVTTVNPLHNPDEMGRQLENARARFAVTVPPLLDGVRAAGDAAGVEEIFVLGEAEGATPFAALLAADGPPPEVELDPARDLAVLPYSSGTTGLPKGVMLTHRNLVANALQTMALEAMDEGERIVGVLPFFHIYGMVVVMLLSLRSGGTVVTMPRFDMEEFLGLIQEHGISRANVVPPIVLGLARHPAVDDYDLSSLEWITSGAAPLAPSVAEACAERVGCVIRQGYGLTETSPVTHFNPPPPARNDPSSIGPPVPNTEVRVVDLETGDDVERGERGEIWIRGPQVMRGYLDRPDATARMLSDDGWLRTGDVGYVDEDDYFFIVDRVKELIKYKGFQVAPAELEAVLLEHDAVADAAVVGSPDEEAGEVPKAFVVLRDEVEPSELMAWVEGRVAPYKKIRRLEVRDEIPKSASGKILRRVLVEEEREGADGG